MFRPSPTPAQVAGMFPRATSSARAGPTSSRSRLVAGAEGRSSVLCSADTVHEGGGQRVELGARRCSDPTKAQRPVGTLDIDDARRARYVPAFR